MRRLLFIFTLALYGYSALELHEWVRVPQVAMHFLEQHTSEEFHALFHAEHGTAGAEEGGDHDHTPFEEDCHGAFCACGGPIALPPNSSGLLLSTAPLAVAVGTWCSPLALNAFSGNVWNPPKA